MKTRGTGLPHATEQEQADFFARLSEGFLAAASRKGEIVREYWLANTLIRLRFAGDALIPVIIPGLATLNRTPAVGPSCEIKLWDSESTGIQLPPPPRPWNDFTRRGNIWGFDSARYRSSYHWGEGSVNVMDRESHQAVYWVPTHRHVPLWVLASPLRSILHWWMEINGCQLAHAASIGYKGRGALIPGRSGSGKSSTSLACLLAGLDFVSDDYLAISLDPEPRTHRLYSTAKLDPRTLSLHPELAARCRTVHQPGFDKIVLFLEDGYRDQLQDSLRLDLTLRPWISGKPKTLMGETEPLEIETALASETLGHLPHSNEQTVEFLNRVSITVPRAAIHLGTNRSEIPDAIRMALEARTLEKTPAPAAVRWQPSITVIVHYSDIDLEEFSALALNLDAQNYPRTELLVVASASACDMAGDVAKLPGTVRFHTYPQPVVRAEAWNRGIRESFAELLVLIEPGSRSPAGLLKTLAEASEAAPDASWIEINDSKDQAPSAASHDWLLIRKNAFRTRGLFPTERFFQGRELKSWLQRAQAEGLSGHSIVTDALDAPRPASRNTGPVPLRPNLAFLRDELIRRRGQKPQ